MASLADPADRRALGHLWWPIWRAQVVLACAIGLAVVGLFARIMSFPVRHDEQMYVPVGALLGQGDLYRDFGFNNLPNWPLLLSAVFGLTGTDHYLLTARLVVFAGWTMALSAIGHLAGRAAGSSVAGMLASLLLATSPALLGPAGMLATNNFLPLPFAITAAALLITGLDRPRANQWLIAGAGVCVGIAAGFKANYVFMIPVFAVAALLGSRKHRLIGRTRDAVVPLVAGGIVGSIPVLVYLLRGPDEFLAHVLRYHRGPHLAYWTANAALDGDKIMTLAGKAQLALSIWLGGGMVLLMAIGGWCAWTSVRSAEAKARPLWPVWFLVALVAGGMIVSFIPTPAFPQYYVLPIPFLIGLVALMFGRLPAGPRAVIAPWLGLATIGVIAAGTPRLLVDLSRIISPDTWTGNVVHDAGVRLATMVEQAKISGPVATLAPLYPLEGGLPLYPELGTGPLVYRVGDLIPPADRRYYRLVSPTTIALLFDHRPPVALLIGQEGKLDDPFLGYARKHAYRQLVPALVSDRYGEAKVYLRRPEAATVR